MDEHSRIKEDVANYYTEKVKEHGPTPQGVDWNSTDSQVLRFQQLAKIIEPGESPYSLLDYGCGYGEFIETARSIAAPVCYTGFDISEEMLKAAKERFGASDQVRWISELSEEEKYDYVVASGIFNVRMSHDDDSWKDYITTVLNDFHKIAVKGFSFNVLTKYSDAEYMREYLFYADPCWLLDYCKTNFSLQVAVLHDYPLYEFTVLVRYGEGARK